MMIQLLKIIRDSLATIRDTGHPVSLSEPISVDDNGGSLTVDGTVTAAQTIASNLNAQIVGNIAHDGIDSGNSLKIGMKAIAHGTNPTAVAEADRTDLYANRAGVPFSYYTIES